MPQLQLPIFPAWIAHSGSPGMLVQAKKCYPCRNYNCPFFRREPSASPMKSPWSAGINRWWNEVAPALVRAVSRLDSDLLKSTPGRGVVGETSLSHFFACTGIPGEPEWAIHAAITTAHFSGMD